MKKTETTMNRAEIAIKDINRMTFVEEKRSFWSRYWFPISVIVIVLIIAFRTFFAPSNENHFASNTKSKRILEISNPNAPLAQKTADEIKGPLVPETKHIIKEEKIVQNKEQEMTNINLKNTEKEKTQIVRIREKPAEVTTKIVEKTVVVKKEHKVFPKFQMVRIGDNGSIIVTGTYKSNSTVSIWANNKNLGTEKTNKYGEFAFTPTTKLKSGNYVLTILGEDGKSVYSKDNVFIYVADNSKAKSSVSLLMTDNGTKILQGPTNEKGDLVLSKIDYLPNERVLVTGHSVPRLNVSLKLNDTVLGTTKVSDTGTFGLGTNIGTLKYDTEYTLTAILKDAKGNIVTETKQSFKFPKWDEKSNVFFTVRKNDTLWLISRYHYGKGSMYSLIFDKNSNKIKNPNIIFPKQVLEIPMFDKQGNKIKG